MKSLQISAYFHLPYEKLYNITYNYDVSYSNILKNQYYIMNHMVTQVLQFTDMQKKL